MDKNNDLIKNFTRETHLIHVEEKEKHRKNGKLIG
jgi:hypothetical protein